MDGIYLGLHPSSRGVRGCLVEPAFGTVLETFTSTWERFPQRVDEHVEPYVGRLNSDVYLAFCQDDPWPDEAVRHLDEIYCGRRYPFSRARVDAILAKTRAILRPEPINFRARLMAFMALRSDINDTDPAIARGWAIQFAREMLFNAETAMDFDIIDRRSDRLFRYPYPG